MTKRLVDRLDDIANRTGVPALAAYPPRRRPLRGLAIAALVLGTVGMGLALGDRPLLWIGEGVLMLGFLVSVWLPILGPIKPWMAASERADERDVEIRNGAYLAVLPLILLIAIAALAGLPALAWMRGQSQPESLAIGGFAAIYLVLLWNAVPTLHASWNTRADDED